jgi:hypothetical protein
MAEQTIFRLGELFCGPGGLACGALRSHSDDGRYGVKHAWSNDYDADTCETYTFFLRLVSIPHCRLIENCIFNVLYALISIP